MEREREWALRRPLITGDKLIAAAAERRLREGPSVLRIWRPKPDKTNWERSIMMGIEFGCSLSDRECQLGTIRVLSHASAKFRRFL